MRKRFEVQYQLGSTPVEKVQIPMHSRDELPPVLRALQHIYSTPRIHDEVFRLLEKQIIHPVTHAHTGRPGMSLWEILVFGAIRLARNADYDHLHYMVNHDRLIRSLVGLSDFTDRPKVYSLQTLKDNLHFFDEALLKKINALVVSEGHFLIQPDGIRVKVDSYVVETHVHFPTDLNLLWDALRKSLDYVQKIVDGATISCGFRKKRSWRRRLKKAYMKAMRSTGSRGRQDLSAVLAYLEMANQLNQKLDQAKDELETLAKGCKAKTYFFKELLYFHDKLKKHIDLVHRRLIQKQTIPHHEKDFSLFEPHTRWISKGKSGKPVELGLPVAVATDQHRFILNHEVMVHENDVDLAVPMVQGILDNGIRIHSVSFDKNFWSPANFERLQSNVDQVIMPKKGKLNAKDHEREHQPSFAALRRQHAAVESDIHCLEQHGLNRCPDKGLKRFKTYVALGVLAYNLHKLGNILLERDRQVLFKSPHDCTAA